MSEIVRFGVSLNQNLLARFDRDIKERGYPTRSKAIEDLIREGFIKSDWVEGKEVAGAITLVYNHHKRELVNLLTDTQHDFHHLVISSQHIHLDHDNCLEIVVVKGRPREIERLANKLKATKGVKHGSLTMTTTGRDV